MRDAAYHQFKYLLPVHLTTRLLLPIGGFFPFLPFFCFLIYLTEGKTQPLKCPLGPLMGYWELFLLGTFFFTCVWPKGWILAQSRCCVRSRFGMQTRTPPCLPSAGDNCPNLPVQTSRSKRAFIHLKPTQACTLLTQRAASWDYSSSQVC